MTLYADELFEQAAPFITYEKDKQTKIATITIKMADQLNAVTTGMRLRYVEHYFMLALYFFKPFICFRNIRRGKFSGSGNDGRLREYTST